MHADLDIRVNILHKLYCALLGPENSCNAVFKKLCNNAASEGIPYHVDTTKHLRHRFVNSNNSNIKTDL